jgi:hypothetical protein
MVWEGWVFSKLGQILVLMVEIKLQRSMEEAEQMKRERSRILSSMSNIKRTVAEIQLHEEELVREVCVLT